MKISPKCPACLLSRVYMESKIATDDEEKVKKAVEESLKILARRYPSGEINAVIATEIHRKVYEILGIEDPYKKLKDKANKIVLENIGTIREFLKKQNDMFRATAIASIIGNTFDYGVMDHNVTETDFISFFIDEFNKGIAIDHLDKIQELCKGKVVYLTDNCGEVIMDSFFLESIKKLSKPEKLTVVVRGRPILSDATLEDAKLAGLDEIADEVLTNGLGAIGIIEEELPPNTMERIKNADVIIAKGMANYECLSGSTYPVAFLLTAKCEPVAESLKVSVGDMVAMMRG